MVRKINRVTRKKVLNIKRKGNANQMKILLLSSTVHPIMDANANCVWQIAVGLKGLGHEVHILQPAFFPAQRILHEINGIHLHAFYMPTQINARDLKAQLKANPFIGFRIALQKIYGKLCEKYDVSLLLRLAWLSPLREAVLRECTANRYDAVVASFFPVECGYVLSKLTAERLLTVPYYVYQLDEYVDNPGHSPAHRAERLAAMQAIYRNSHGATLTVLQLNQAREYVPEMSDRFVELHHPLMVKKNPPVPTQNLIVNSAVNCVYVGSLYPGIREPYYLLNLFEKLADPTVHLHLLLGNKYKIDDLAHWQAVFGPRLHIRSFVPADECTFVMQHAQVLVNLGNSATRQIPSKVLDYVSTGRPVLNISTIPECTSLMYLRQYPKALNLLTDEAALDRQAELLHAFIAREAFAPPLPFETVEELYRECTPTYVAGRLVALMRGADGGGHV